MFWVVLCVDASRDRSDLWSDFVVISAFKLLMFLYVWGWSLWAFAALFVSMDLTAMSWGDAGLRRVVVWTSRSWFSVSVLLACLFICVWSLVRVIFDAAIMGWFLLTLSINFLDRFLLSSFPSLSAGELCLGGADYLFLTYLVMDWSDWLSSLWGIRNGDGAARFLCLFCCSISMYWSCDTPCGYSSVSRCCSACSWSYLKPTLWSSLAAGDLEYLYFCWYEPIVSWFFKADLIWGSWLKPIFMGCLSTESDGLTRNAPSVDGILRKDRFLSFWSNVWNICFGCMMDYGWWWPSVLLLLIPDWYYFSFCTFFLTFAASIFPRKLVFGFVSLTSIEILVPLSWKLI